MWTMPPDLTRAGLSIMRRESHLPIKSWSTNVVVLILILKLETARSLIRSKMVIIDPCHGINPSTGWLAQSFITSSMPKWINYIQTNQHPQKLSKSVTVISRAVFFYLKTGIFDLKPKLLLIFLPKIQKITSFFYFFLPNKEFWSNLP